MRDIIETNIREEIGLSRPRITANSPSNAVIS